MKIFIARKTPSVKFYYKVLSFLLQNGCREEIDSYLNIIEKTLDEPYIL